MTLTCDSRDLMTDAPDRRRDERFDEEREVRLFEPFSGRFYVGTTCNVSSTGACVRLPAAISLRAGRFVTVQDSDYRALRLDLRAHARPTARVVWTRVDPTDINSVLVGLELYAATIAAAA